MSSIDEHLASVLAGPPQPSEWVVAAVHRILTDLAPNKPYTLVLADRGIAIRWDDGTRVEIENGDEEDGTVVVSWTANHVISVNQVSAFLRKERRL